MALHETVLRPECTRPCDMLQLCECRIGACRYPRLCLAGKCCGADSIRALSMCCFMILMDCSSWQAFGLPCQRRAAAKHASEEAQLPGMHQTVLRLVGRPLRVTTFSAVLLIKVLRANISMVSRKALACLLLGLLCTAAFAEDQDVEGEAEDEDYEEEVPDRGFLVVRKKVIEADVVQGKDFTIQLSLHNAGSRQSLTSTP